MEHNRSWWVGRKPPPTRAKITDALRLFAPSENQERLERCIKQMPEKNGTPKAERQMRPVTGMFAKFESEGDMVEGAYDGFSFIEQKSGPVPKYLLLGDDGAVAFLGTLQIIEALQRVPLGAWVRIVYTGIMEKTANFRVKIFDISVEEGTELLPALTPARVAQLPAAVDPETGEIPF